MDFSGGTGSGARPRCGLHHVAQVRHDPGTELLRIGNLEQRWRRRQRDHVPRKPPSKFNKVTFERSPTSGPKGGCKLSWSEARIRAGISEKGADRLRSKRLTGSRRRARICWELEAFKTTRSQS